MEKYCLQLIKIKMYLFLFWMLGNQQVQWICALVHRLSFQLCPHMSGRRNDWTHVHVSQRFISEWGPRTTQDIFLNWVPPTIILSLLTNSSLLVQNVSEFQLVFCFCVLRAGITGISADIAGLYGWLQWTQVLMLAQQRCTSSTVTQPLVCLS